MMEAKRPPMLQSAARMTLTVLFLLPMLLAHRPVGFQPRSSVLRRMPMFYGKRDPSMAAPPSLSASLKTAHTSFLTPGFDDETQQHREAETELDLGSHDVEMLTSNIGTTVDASAESRAREFSTASFPGDESMPRSFGEEEDREYARVTQQLRKISPVLFQRLMSYIKSHQDSARSASAKPFGEKPNRYNNALRDTHHHTKFGNSQSPVRQVSGQDPRSKPRGVKIFFENLDRSEHKRHSDDLSNAFDMNDDVGGLRNRLENLARALHKTQSSADGPATSESEEVAAESYLYHLLKNGFAQAKEPSEPTENDRHDRFVSDQSFDKLFSKTRKNHLSTQVIEDW